METTCTKNLYASRKRSKPALKSVKEFSGESVKSNPSKRHRDRLNGELDRLASLLPFHQDVIAKLDKLTVLRLSVGCLRAKSHFNSVLESNSYTQPANNDVKTHVQDLSEGELLLQAINGFVLVVTSNSTILYVSSTVEDYLGFHQSDIIHQSVYELIHTEDRAEFQQQLHWALNPSNSPDSEQIVQASQDSLLPHTYYSPEQLPPENSAFLERNFMCRLRCLLNNSSGFLALNFQGRLKLLHGQNEKTSEGKPIPPQLALFALACPVQPPSILEIRAKNFIFRTKHKLDFTPTACDAKGKIVLGYTDAELCYRGSGYQYIHAADMLHCAENHIRMIKTGESGLTVFRLLTKQSGWVWVQANARLIYKNGQPDFIIASQRVLMDEEGEEILKKRSLTHPFSFTTGEAVLYEINPNTLLSGLPSSTEYIPSVAPGDSNQPKLPGGLDPNSLLGSMLKQDASLYVCHSGSDEPMRTRDPDEEEDDLGRIFSSNWQRNILSLSDTSVFKADPAITSGGEEGSCEIMSFMGSLGITPEDLELLQQEDLFFNMELDGRYGFEEFKDDVLSYVQESLRKKVDDAHPNSVQANPEERLLSCIAPQPQHPSEPSLIPWSQGQKLFLHSPLMSQSQQQHLSFLVEPSEAKMQPFTPNVLHQSYSQSQQSPGIQDTQQNHQGSLQALSRIYNQPSVSPLGLHLNSQHQLLHPVNHKHVYQPEFSCFFCPERDVYHKLKHPVVNDSDSISVTESGSFDQELPVILQSELQQPGSFFLESNHVPQELPESINCNPAYIATGHSHMHEYLGELLTCLDSVGQETHGLSAELHGANHPLCAQSSLDRSMLQQPSVGQNGVLGNLQGSFEEEGIGDLISQPPQQNTNDSRPLPDVSLGYM